MEVIAEMIEAETKDTVETVQSADLIVEQNILAEMTVIVDHEVDTNNSMKQPENRSFLLCIPHFSILKYFAKTNRVFPISVHIVIINV